MQDDVDAHEAKRDARQSSVELLPLVYDELRGLARSRMRKVPPGNTLDPTALVHEAFLRLGGPHSARWDGPGHFFVAAAEAMRRILVDQARRKAAGKHGGSLDRVSSDDVEVVFAEPVEDVIALNDAINRLAEDYPRKAQLVLLRRFAGLSREESAAALGISLPTVDRDWRFVTARLHAELSGDDPSPEGRAP